MLIGLISDTHIPLDTLALPPHVKMAFQGVELILHAGDIYVPKVLDELETIAPVLVARGNGDLFFPKDSRMKENQVLELEGLRVGVTHAFYPDWPADNFAQAMDREFGGHVDIIVYGDTHVAWKGQVYGTFMINPGSPALPNGRYQLGTVGLLEIDQGKVNGHIIQLSDFNAPFERKLIYRPGCNE